MIKLNMRSSANAVKSQGVGSCYDEQVALVKEGLEPRFAVSENKIGRFDLVHYHTVNLGYFLERLLSRRHTVGIGYVHFLPATLDESLNLPGPFRKLFYKYLLTFYNSMDYLVTVNPFFVQRIAEYGITRPKVTCIPNFVASKYFHPMNREETVPVRQRFGLAPDDFVVLGVGQLQTRKGIFDFVETAKRLPHVQFVWAGGFSFGKMSDGYDEIKALMKGLPDNVRFIGIVDRLDMPGIYNMADVMFLPSFDELFPMAILEALCCKKPVLVRDIPLYENVLHGCCVTGKTVEGFAAAIVELARDADTYAYWQDRAWECHQIYSEENALKQWESFYLGAYGELSARRMSLRTGKAEL